MTRPETAEPEVTASHADGPDGGARSWRVPVLAWCGVAAALFVTQVVARGRDGFGWGERLVAGWIQFDGPEYLSIATEGYRARQLVWFPLYPALIASTDVVLPGSVAVAAVLVSAAAGLAAAVLFWRWTATVPVRRDGRIAMASPNAARWVGLAVFLLYPYGWFLYGVVYADALFLAAVVAAFLAAERDRPGWAGLLGALATAARPSGFAVVAGLFVLVLERQDVLTVRAARDDWASKLRLPVQVHLNRLRSRSFLPLLSASGLVIYMAYQWVWWDQPLRFVTEQGNYHSPGTDTLLKRQFFDAFSQPELFDTRHLATTSFQALILAAVVMSVPAVGRRFGWGYAVYALGLATLPAVSVSTFMGVGRYLLPAFPCWALAGEWLADRPRWRTAWLATSAVLLVVMSAGFARSWYLT